MWNFRTSPLLWAWNSCASYLNVHELFNLSFSFSNKFDIFIKYISTLMKFWSPGLKRMKFENVLLDFENLKKVEDVDELFYLPYYGVLFMVLILMRCLRYYFLCKYTIMYYYWIIQVKKKGKKRNAKKISRFEDNCSVDRLE